MSGADIICHVISKTSWYIIKLAQRYSKSQIWIERKSINITERKVYTCSGEDLGTTSGKLKNLGKRNWRFLKVHHHQTVSPSKKVSCQDHQWKKDTLLGDFFTHSKTHGLSNWNNNSRNCSQDAVGTKKRWTRNNKR